jgi:hypothetical protein
MPIKITKKSKKTKKGKGKVSQSQQVIVNIQKGKRKASSQPSIRTSQPPIIIQPPQQDYTQLENLFKQYSTSRPIAEPVKPVTIGMDTQTEMPITTGRETQTDLSIPPNMEENIKATAKNLAISLKKLEEEKPIPVARQRQPAPQRKPPVPIQENRPRVSLLPVRTTAPPTPPEKILNPLTNKMVTPDYYKRLVREGKVIPEKK